MDQPDSLPHSVGLIARRFFYDSNEPELELPTGLTIDEMLVACNWDPAVREFTVVLIGGLEVPQSIWHAVRPKPGMKLFITIQPQKKGLKQVLMAVAMVVVAVVAWYAAPALVGFLGGTAYTAGIGGAAVAAGTVGATLSVTSLAVAAGLTAVGTMALSALVKPPSANALSGVDAGSLSALGGTGTVGSNSGNPGTAGAEAKSYGLTVNSNQSRQYGVVPRVLGRHRVTPNLAAENYIVAEGGVQTAYMLLDFGEGPTFIEDIRIGTTPISQYPSVEYRWHPDYTANTPLSFFSGDNATARVDSTIELNQAIVRLVPQSSDYISIEIMAPSGLIQLNTDGLRVHSEVNISVYYALEGQPWNDIRWADPWIQYRGDAGVGASGFNQIGGVGFVGLDSTQKKLRIAYPNTEPQQGQTLMLSDGFYYRILNWEQLPYDPAWNNEGNWWWQFPHGYAIIDGFPASTTMTSMLETRPTLGLYNTVPTPSMADNWSVYPNYNVSNATITFRGRTQTAQSATINFRPPFRGLWQVLIVGNTQAFVGTSSINQLTWTSVRGTRYGNPVVPRTQRSLLEVRITATENLNGQIGAFSALITSLVRLWDGNLYGTRNPAHLVLEVLTGPAAVKKVPWDEINIDKFWQWSQWCNDISPQGDVRCTCDMIVDTRTTVGELVTLIASNGRATITVVNGKYDVLMEDEPRTPVQLFTERNTKGTSIQRSWVNQPHAIKVSYVNEATWEKDETIAYADGYDANNASVFERLDLTGCTRGWQAWRDGRYYLAASQLRRETIEFNTDLENIVCKRGDMVLFSHDTFYGAVGARMMEWVGYGLLRVDVRLEDNAHTHARIRYSDGTQSDMTVGTPEEDLVFCNDWLASNQANGQRADTATVGNPGAPPVGWYMNFTSLSHEITSKGTYHTLPHFWLHIWGTPMAGASLVLSPGDNGAAMVPATYTQIVEAALFMFGSFPAGSTAQMQFVETAWGDPTTLHSEVYPIPLYQWSDGAGFMKSAVAVRHTVKNTGTSNVAVYTLVTFPQGVPMDANIAIGNYFATVISTATGIHRSPEIDDLMTLGVLGNEVTEWIVDKVTPGAELSAKINLMERRPEILLADRGPIPPYVPPGSNGYMLGIQPPYALALTWYEGFDNGRPVYFVTATWAAPSSTLVSRYEIYDSRDSATAIGTTIPPVFRFTVDRLTLARPDGNDIYYRVELVTPRGKRSTTPWLLQHWWPETTPPVILRFSTNVVGTQALLFWEVDGAPDLDHYQIRFSEELRERDWTKMTIAIDQVSGAATTATFLRRMGTYAIRAVDTGGNWSVPEFATIYIDYPENLNLYSNLTAGVSWDGVHDRTEIVDGKLTLVPGELEGWWYADSNVFETESWRFRTTGSISAYAVNSLVPDDWNAEIWVSSLGASPVLASDWFIPLATAIPLAGAAGAYSPIRALQVTDLDAVIVRWAIRLSRDTTETDVFVNNALLRLENEQRSEHGENVPVPIEGFRILFQKKYYHVPTVSISVDSLGSGDIVRVTKQTYLDGFFVQGYDVNDQPCAGSVDWQSIGFGRQGQ